MMRHYINDVSRVERDLATLWLTAGNCVEGFFGLRVPDSHNDSLVSYY